MISCRSRKHGAGVDVAQEVGQGGRGGRDRDGGRAEPRTCLPGPRPSQGHPRPDQGRRSGHTATCAGPSRAGQGMLDLEDAIARAELVLAVRLVDMTEAKIVHGGKTEVITQQFRFEPVRTLEGDLREGFAVADRPGPGDLPVRRGGGPARARADAAPPAGTAGTGLLQLQHRRLARSVDPPPPGPGRSAAGRRRIADRRHAATRPRGQGDDPARRLAQGQGPGRRPALDLAESPCTGRGADARCRRGRRPVRREPVARRAGGGGEGDRRAARRRLSPAARASGAIRGRPGGRARLGRPRPRRPDRRARRPRRRGRRRATREPALAWLRVDRDAATFAEQAARLRAIGRSGRGDQGEAIAAFLDRLPLDAPAEIQVAAGRAMGQLDPREAASRLGKRLASKWEAGLGIATEIGLIGELRRDVAAPALLEAAGRSRGTTSGSPSPRPASRSPTPASSRPWPPCSTPATTTSDGRRARPSGGSTPTRPRASLAAPGPGGRPAPQAATGRVPRPARLPRGLCLCDRAYVRAPAPGCGGRGAGGDPRAEGRPRAEEDLGEQQRPRLECRRDPRAGQARPGRGRASAAGTGRRPEESPGGAGPDRAGRPGRAQGAADRPGRARVPQRRGRRRSRPRRPQAPGRAPRPGPTRCATGSPRCWPTPTRPRSCARRPWSRWSRSTTRASPAPSAPPFATADWRAPTCSGGSKSNWHCGERS